MWGVLCVVVVWVVVGGVFFYLVECCLDGDD